MTRKEISQTERGRVHVDREINIEIDGMKQRDERHVTRGESEEKNVGEIGVMI